ncbi:hypothetical protein Pyn_20703 [Prunus yedoensis var. nudiflora]|uniref:Uncharacterized protein n=1 Tax=Prunus yedoensis var. nudiflora TaxID=2094558 RepID=A0A314ZMS1_PRUYE|nr:hypothetical protein Pyn_20703 [Prunus yedoensis var. nudiflora]
MERGSRRYQKNWLRKESRTHERAPSVQVRKVTVGREGSSVTGTVRATCSIGELSSPKTPPAAAVVKRSHRSCCCEL